MIYRPEYVLFMGIGVYSLIFLVSPIELRVSVEIGSIVFICITIVTFVLGSWFADRFRQSRSNRRLGASQLKKIENRIYFTTLWLGIFGNFLRLVDKYVLRGIGNSTGLEAREILVEAGSSNLSLIGGVLYPFGYLPIFILLGARILPRTRRKLIMAAFVFLIPSIDALVLFSRSFMLVSLAMVYFGTSLTLFQGRALPRKLVIPVLAGVGVVLTISVLAFLWRLEQMSFDISDSIYLSGYAYTVGPSSAVEVIIRDGGALGGLVAALLAIAQYYVHSIPEFQILWSGYEAQSFSGGALHFAPYVKFLAILGLSSEVDVFSLFPRVGVFTSFWGPLWVDFGWFSPIVMFFFGFIARKVGRSARNRDIGAYPLYTYFCVVLFFMPVVNFVISAQGMYVINAFFLFWLMTRKSARTVL